MPSRWRVALIFSAVSALVLSLPALGRAAGVSHSLLPASRGAAGKDTAAVSRQASPALGGPVAKVTYKGMDMIPEGEIRSGTLLERGSVFSDSLLGRELSRIDSLYFSYGLLAAEFSVDTFLVKGGIDVRLDISEGGRTTIGRVSASGSKIFDPAVLPGMLNVREGDYFDPVALEESMRGLLRTYNNSGYPYAQVWLTGFEYDGESNVADLSFTIFEGEETVISRVIFEGLSKTDTSFAVRISRLRPGSVYHEGDVQRSVEYLRSAELFESVGDTRVERREGGNVDVVIPISEMARSNRFQGAFGFSKKDGGDYILNGSAELELRNIAGRGGDASFEWLNDGEKYSKIEVRISKPFLLSMPVHVEAEISQIVQDTVYTWHSGGLYFRFPLGPDFSILSGAAVDRNVPGVGELIRSIRQRYRLGFERKRGSRRLSLHIDGAYKRSYLAGNRAESEGQFLYRLEGSADFPTFGSQAVFLRLVSEAVFSSKDIPAAEMFPMGGAKSLRGYRENQFRGERIGYLNLEYRFGEEGRLFLFDDIGTYYRDGGGWTFKNGVGFGLRSASALGEIELSFGVGERLSLEGTRIHISLQEHF